MKLNITIIGLIIIILKRKKKMQITGVLQKKSIIIKLDIIIDSIFIF